ncbi:hypothetical protein [Luteimonas panaciterrae]|uniref:hypothetical protein n=1 Tax=Luteimonas panaciterrae TaxID=363885 RepID=UPI001CFC41AB|nr:hypothetical protein [Luteimonas panaciterrae]
MRSVLICLLLAGSAAASATPRHLTLVNDGPRRISAVHSAVPGSNDWRSVSIVEGGLSGGGDAETLKMETGPGCLSDLRIAFAGNRQLIVRGFNVCRYHSLRAGTAWRLGHAQQRAQAIIATKDESGSHP